MLPEAYPSSPVRSTQVWQGVMPAGLVRTRINGAWTIGRGESFPKQRPHLTWTHGLPGLLRTCAAMVRLAVCFAQYLRIWIPAGESA